MNVNVKTVNDDSIERFMARLVVQGFYTNERVRLSGDISPSGQAINCPYYVDLNIYTLIASSSIGYQKCFLRWGPP